MYTDFREINALYHHGIKGQKWGVINEKDDPSSRVASEKNRLDYDAKIARYQGELEAVKQNNATDLKIAKEETKRTVLEGKAKVHEALVQASADKTKAKAERDAKFKKYAMIGAAIAGTLWTSRKLMNVWRDNNRVNAVNKRPIIKLTKAVSNS